jgi:hypothetical protein
MAARSVHSLVARFVVITLLAVSLFAGSHALVKPMHASAAPYSCEHQVQLYNLYRSHGYLYETLYYGTGNPQYAYLSGYYYGLADQLWVVDCV